MVDADELVAPGLTGEITDADSARAQVAEDFGHLVTRTPAIVAAPESTPDVAATVRWASRAGHRIAARGRGHSVYGRSLVAGGVVIDLACMSGVEDVRPDHVVVQAGASWRDVLAATLPQGLSPPVLPDFLDLSVGGTLVVGGVGATSCRLGVLTDHVLELEVVTGRGETVRCSRRNEAELFDAVRAGLAQVGVITRVNLRLVPAPAQVRRSLLIYPDLSSMLWDARRLAADELVDVVQGAIVPGAAGGWVYRLDVASYLHEGHPVGEVWLPDGLADDRALRETCRTTYADYVDRSSQLETMLRDAGLWDAPHPWLMTFMGDVDVESAVADELERMTAADLGRFGQIVLSPIRSAAIDSPMLRLPEGELCFAFNLVRFPTSGNDTEVDRLLTANQASYRRLRSAGGTLYPVSAFPMSAEEWRAHFGPAFARLSAARATHDPEGILTPGYEIF